MRRVRSWGREWMPGPRARALVMCFITPAIETPLPMLRLNTGIARKIGLPNYGSAGASCNLEIELDAGLFQDLEQLQQAVRRAYAACNHAVQHELARTTGGHQASGRHDALAARDATRGHTTAILADTVTTDIRPATRSQVRAIRAIAARRRVVLQALLQERFGIGAADELSLPQASELIDELKRDCVTVSTARLTDLPDLTCGTNNSANADGS